MATFYYDDTRQNKLQLVNKCLIAIGETPLPDGTVPSEFPLGTDFETASRIVDDTWVEVCNRGWWFNTDYNFPLTPDSTGIIALPASVLRLDGGRYHPFIKKQGLLYDRRTKSFTFNSTQYVNLIWASNYSELPVAAYEYIGARAARKFYSKIIGAPAEVNFLVQEETDALVNLQRENAQYLDANLLDEMVTNRWANPLRGW